ncbi:hypothetical protein ACIF6L_31520 [Kitasatospora sp. NPDC086009]|uniref:hypothetical protein n=1 Tax=unclassified Kitasatospora TaxID=2633591 RepID=UPI0037CCACB5
MIEGLSSDADVPAGILLAGYFVAVPERRSGSGMPWTERLTTASDCLIDWLPEDGSWFGTAGEALEACLLVQVPVEARLYALLVPADHVSGFVTDILTAGTDEPVLLAHLDSRDGGVARQVAAGGHVLGWEVLGYDEGLLHSWLCNNLYDDGVRELGVGTGEHGLLPDRKAAVRVAAWANMRGDTKPVTWFPGALMEWDAPVQGRITSAAADAPAPPDVRPWWRRIL